MSDPSRRIRVLIGKPGLDGHDRGARVVASALRDAGMEVIYSGLRASVEAIGAAAIQEDVDVIGLSILSGAHEAICQKLVAYLKERGAPIALLVGGVIPPADHDKLYALGVAAVFGPESPLDKVVGAVRTLAEGGNVEREAKGKLVPLGQQLDHVAVAVKDLDAALAIFEQVLGRKAAHRELVESQKVEAAFIDFGNGTSLELICPRGSEGVQKFLEKKGEAMHHLALKVDDLAGVLDALAARGLTLIDKAPRPGARGHRVAFIHPRSTGGVLVELVEHAHGTNQRRKP